PVGQRTQAPGGGFGERLQLDDARFGGQREQPFDLDPDPRMDQPMLGKHRPQRIDLGGVAAVERRQGEELGVWHGWGRRRWGINSKRWRRYPRAVPLQEMPGWPRAAEVSAPNTTAWASSRCLQAPSGAHRPSGRWTTSRSPADRCRAASSVRWAW